MNVLLIIRTFPKEEHLALHCAASAIHHKVCSKIMFLPEEGDYVYLNHYTKRKFAGNMGGISFVKSFHESIKGINADGYDYIMLCDSDVTFKKNFAHELDVDHCGIMDGNGKINEQCKHISGQCQIFSKRAWDRVISSDNEVIDNAAKWIVESNYSIADDTVYSVIVQVGTDYTVKNLDFNDYWIHSKFIYD